jgi:hypothetical protein
LIQRHSPGSARPKYSQRSKYRRYSNDQVLKGCLSEPCHATKVRKSSARADHLFSSSYTPSKSLKIPAVGKNATVLASWVFF